MIGRHQGLYGAAVHREFERSTPMWLNISERPNSALNLVYASMPKDAIGLLTTAGARFACHPGDVIRPHCSRYLS